MAQMPVRNRQQMPQWQTQYEPLSYMKVFNKCKAEIQTRVIWTLQNFKTFIYLGIKDQYLTSLQHNPDF